VYACAWVPRGQRVQYLSFSRLPDFLLLSILSIFVRIAKLNHLYELVIAKMLRSSSPERLVFVVYPLCPPHLRNTIEEAVESFNGSWLLPP
jgi:hypothetical protein